MPGGGYPASGSDQAGPGSKGWTPYGMATGWWKRVGATLIDALIVLVVSSVVVVFTGLIAGDVVWVVLTAVYVVSMLSQRGQTVGNMAVSTRVVDGASGHRPSVTKAVVRWTLDGVLGIFGLIASLNRVGVVVDLTVLIGLIDYLWPLWDARNQTLHDKVAGTFVILTGD